HDQLAVGLPADLQPDGALRDVGVADVLALLVHDPASVGAADTRAAPGDLGEEGEAVALLYEGFHVRIPLLPLLPLRLGLLEQLVALLGRRGHRAAADQQRRGYERGCRGSRDGRDHGGLLSRSWGFWQCRNVRRTVSMPEDEKNHWWQRTQSDSTMLASR